MTGDDVRLGLPYDRRLAATEAGWSPDRVVMVSHWLAESGGGVNTVIKDQIDYLTHVFGIPVDILMEGGDYKPEDPAKFSPFPDSGNPDSLYEVIRRHILDPIAKCRRIAVIIHNILTVPYSRPLNEALRRIIAEVEQDAMLRDMVQFIAWTHDVFDVPQEVLRGVTYVAVSEERQRAIARYFHLPLSRIPIALNAVNLRRMMSLSPETEWLWNTFRLYEEDFVAYYPVRLARNKNIEAAIAIVAALNRMGKRTTLLLPGIPAGECYQEHYCELRELAAVLNIPQKIIFTMDLIFKGQPLRVADEVVRDLYKLASFLLFTSRDEGFGLPLIEAAAWRLPAVISSISSLTTISQGTGTLVVDPDHEAVDQIASRIIDYMTGNPTYKMQRRVISVYNMAHQFQAIGWTLPTGSHTPWRIGTQTSNYYLRWRIEDQFLDAVRNGLDAFEIFFDPKPSSHLGFDPGDLKEDIRRWLRENAGKQDVRLSVYARRHFLDAAERRRHWEQCVAVAHDVAAALVVFDLPPPAAFAHSQFPVFVRDLQDVIESAHTHGIQVAIENGSLADAAAGCLTSAEDINELFRQLTTRERAVGVSFNAGRAHLLENPVAYLRKIHPPIFHVKLSDNQGPGHDEVHQRLGEGKLPLAPLLEELHGCGYRGMIILEYFYAAPRLDRARIEAALDAALKAPSRCVRAIAQTGLAS